ncbi:MAG: hypothetical protein AABX31_02350 [Nanoarchaeota archaeon]
MKQKGIARHHVLSVFLLILIITLGVAAYFLQRNAAVETLAGEAFRQRANPPGDLGLAPTPEPFVAKESVVNLCPSELTSVDQHWDLSGWKLLPWKAVDVQCSGINQPLGRMTCYYSHHNIAEPTYYDPKYILHADHIAFYQDIEGVKKCGVVKSPGGSYGCLCEKLS